MNDGLGLVDTAILDFGDIVSEDRSEVVTGPRSGTIRGFRSRVVAGCSASTTPASR